MLDFSQPMFDPVFTQRMSNMWVMYLAVRPSAERGGKVNWTQLSVRTAWIL